MDIKYLPPRVRTFSSHSIWPRVLQDRRRRSFHLPVPVVLRDTDIPSTFPFHPSSTLPPSVLPLTAAARTSFGPSLGRTCTASNRSSGRSGRRRIGRSWGWYGTRGLDDKPLRFLLLLLAPRVHRLDEQAADRARCDEEDPFGDARDKDVDFG